MAHFILWQHNTGSLLFVISNHICPYVAIFRQIKQWKSAVSWCHLVLANCSVWVSENHSRYYVCASRHPNRSNWIAHHSRHPYRTSENMIENRSTLFGCNTTFLHFECYRWAKPRRGSWPSTNQMVFYNLSSVLLTINPMFRCHQNIFGFEERFLIHDELDYSTDRRTICIQECQVRLIARSVPRRCLATLLLRLQCDCPVEKATVTFCLRSFLTDFEPFPRVRNKWQGTLYVALSENKRIILCHVLFCNQYSYQTKSHDWAFHRSRSDMTIISLISSIFWYAIPARSLESLNSMPGSPRNWLCERCSFVPATVHHQFLW